MPATIVMKIRLRPQLAASLRAMHRKHASKEISFGEYVSQLIEVSAADYRLASLPPPPTLVSSGRKLSAADVQTIQQLKEAGLKTGEISQRFRVSAMTVRRALLRGVIFRDT